MTWPAQEQTRQTVHAVADPQGGLEIKDAARPDRKRLWFLAIKPPMYNVALIPILVRPVVCSGDMPGQVRLLETSVSAQVAGAAAYAATGSWSARLTSQLILGSFCIIAWLNTR